MPTQSLPPALHPSPIMATSSLRTRDIARDLLSTLAKNGLDLDAELNAFIIQRSCALLSANSACIDGVPAARVDAIVHDVFTAPAEPEPEAAEPEAAVADAEEPAAPGIPYVTMTRKECLNLCVERGLNRGVVGFHQALKGRFVTLLEADDARMAEPEAEVD